MVLGHGRWLVAALVLGATVAWSVEAAAHWCNNIWSSPARLVVKPEKTTVNVGGGTTQLRVYVRNNFPYRIFGVKMRGDASGYSIPETAGQDIYASQEASFLLSISPTGGATGDVQVSTLDLQVWFRVGNWHDSSGCLVDQNPSETMLVARSEYGVNSPACVAGNQSASLSAATLADSNPSKTLAAGQPTFGRTGIQQLINFFGYRFCYSSTGGWRSGTDDCPSPVAEGNPWTSVQQFGQNCMRAGVELAMRKAQLGSQLQAARAAAVNALKAGGSNDHVCIAAVAGGYLWQGAADASAFTAALAATHVPQKCQDAGLRVLDGSHASGSCSGAHYEEAACAAAEGLNGNDGPVKSVLMPKSGDGEQNGGYDGLYYAYMLYLVANHYRSTTGGVPFYPDAGGTAPPPPPDTGTPPPPQDSGTPPPPPQDSGTPPPPQDSGTPPPPPDDSGVTPPPPGSDGAVTPPPPGSDGAVTPPPPGSDGAVTPPGADGGTNPATGGAKLDGGCAVIAGSATLPLWLLALLGLVARRLSSFRSRRSR